MKISSSIVSGLIIRMFSSLLPVVSPINEGQLRTVGKPEFMCQYQIRRLLPAAAVIASVTLYQPQSGIYQIIGALMAEHDGIRIPRTDLGMPEPAVILQHRMAAARLQIHIYDPAMGLCLTGQSEKVPVVPFLPLRKGKTSRFPQSP